MNVKTDTKEKFTVIMPAEACLSVNMTEELVQMLLGYLQKDIPHVVLNLQQVERLEENSGALLAECQHQFYDNNCSLVICALQPAVEEALDHQELLELMNVTPTESEAWDIVQMEEIERELLNDDELT
jgi:anti-anti-sigma factor